MKKRILSTFLVLSLCLSLLPTAALADSASEPDVSGGSIAEISQISTSGQSVSYIDSVSEFAAAFTNAKTTKITLLKDISATESDFDTPYVDGALTLDLNGHALDISTNITIRKHLTILDSSGKSGTFSYQGLTLGDQSRTIQGDMTVSGGKLSGPIAVEWNTRSTLRVSGGEIAGTVNVYDFYGGITVTGGKIREVLVGSYSLFNISGGEIAKLALGANARGGISGGTFGSVGYDSSLGSTYYNVPPHTYLSAGYAFYDENEAIVNALTVLNLKNVTVGPHECSFGNDGCCACGRETFSGETDIPEDAVVLVDYGTYTQHLTLEQLEYLFQSYIYYTCTLTLLDDADLSSMRALCNIQSDLTVDLNGHDLTLGSLCLYTTGNLTVLDSSTDKTGTLAISNYLSTQAGSQLTLMSGTIQFTGNGSYDTLGGSLTINGGTFDLGTGYLSVEATGALTVNSGKLTSVGCGNANIFLSNDAYSTTGISLDESTTQDTTLAQDAGEHMRVNGGTVEAVICVVMGTTLTVTGGTIKEPTSPSTPLPGGVTLDSGVFVAGGTVKVSSGSIVALSVEDGTGCEVALSGGTFGKVSYASYSAAPTGTAADFLAEGFAYYQKDDNSKVVNTSVTPAPENVTVLPHNHTNTASDGTYACGCGLTYSQEPVSYIDAYGKTRSCTSYTVVNSSMSGSEHEWAAGWYVVNTDVTIDGTAYLASGDIHLILKDGCTLNVQKGIRSVEVSNSLQSALTIYGQSAGTGKLTVSGSTDTISQMTATYGLAVKRLVVNGGTVEVSGKADASQAISYGIYAQEDVTVNNGVVSATGWTAASENNSASSSGIFAPGGVTVNGGTVTAVGGEVTGGSTTSSDPDRGTATSCGICIDDSGALTVNGGAVTAKGGKTTARTSGKLSASYGINVQALNVSGGTLNAEADRSDTVTAAGDIWVNDSFALSGGTVRRSTSVTNVIVTVDQQGSSSMTVTGGTIRLAAGSSLRKLRMKSDGGFYTLLDDGLDYYTAEGAQLSAGNMGSESTANGYLYTLFGSDAPICVRAKNTSDTSVPYLDETAAPQYCTIYTDLSTLTADAAGNITLGDGWYVLSESRTIEGKLTINGSSTHLILCDGKTLTVKKGLDSRMDYNCDLSLTIYGQSQGTGKLSVSKTASSDDVRGIALYGTLTVNGGVIDVSANSTVSSSDNEYSIYGIDVYAMTINGGKVTTTAGSTTPPANGTYTACGVYGLDAATLTVNGGELTAISGAVSADNSYTYALDVNNMVVNGGTVTAKTGAVSANGGKYGGWAIAIYVRYSLAINGGTVSAQGGAVSTKDTDECGSYGIYVVYNNMTVNGGTVTAKSGAVNTTRTTPYSAFYGTSTTIYVSESSLIVNGGTISAESGSVTVTNNAAPLTNEGTSSSSPQVNGYSYCIYAWSTIINGGEITASGGNVSVTGNNHADESDRAYSYGISSQEITISGGKLTATGGSTKVSNSKNPVAWSLGVYANTYLNVYSGTVTAKASRDTSDSYTDIYVSSSMSVYAGTVRSSTSGGAVNAFVNFALTVRGGTVKLAKGTEFYSIYVYNGINLPDLLDSGCCYYATTCNYRTGTESSAKVTDLSANRLEGSKTYDNYETVTLTYYGVDTDPDASSNTNGGFTGGTANSTTTKKPDGSTTTTTDPATGSVTETTTTPDGVTGTTTTDKNGNVTDISASVPGSAVKDGAAAALPIEVPAADSSENAVEIKITVPSGGATVEIPVENVTPGTVVIVVNKDGSETIISGTKQTETGVKVTLSESATIKIVDNSERFSDVPANAYYADAVAWASAREITGGVGGGKFGPDVNCTRAQIITLLWRAAGCPEVTSDSTFTDVPADAYYAKAVAWAVETGITGGVGGGKFAPDVNCSRAQAAAFLFRYAVSQGANTAATQELVSGYTDAGLVSDYALSAFNWALAEGVIQGASGKLLPNDECTRAQIVTMLYRLLGK